MGLLADTLNQSEQGCSVILKLQEVNAREDVTDDDKAELAQAIADHEFPPRAIIRALSTIGVSISADVIQKHRMHGDCTKTRKTPRRGDLPTVIVPTVVKGVGKKK